MRHGPNFRRRANLCRPINMTTTTKHGTQKPTKTSPACLEPELRSRPHFDLRSTDRISWSGRFGTRECASLVLRGTIFQLRFWIKPYADSACQRARTLSPEQPLDFSFPWVSCVAQRDVHGTWRLGSYQREGDNTNVTAQAAEVASSSRENSGFLPFLLLLSLLLLPLPILFFLFLYLLPRRRMLGGCIAVRCCPITHILTIFFSFPSLCGSLLPATSYRRLHVRVLKKCFVFQSMFSCVHFLPFVLSVVPLS
ncbi:uncharacterized protein J3D65DRAFT_68328 [Phyllosticta citribraziliensis]|uniref:Uncharacterized protein n=1 Tax=Phyllosticta citribraziliensis TaxID=989973 RepID=A0ABR1LEV9_9PEZI